MEQDYLDDVMEKRAASDPEYAAAHAKDEIMDALIERRKSLGLTQQQVADRMRVRRERVAELERNAHKASFERIYAYAYVVGANLKLEIGVA